MKSLKIIITTIFVVSVFTNYTNAKDDSIKLLIHHFLPKSSTTHKDFIEPWAKKIEEESQGRLKFDIFPSMTLGGKPPELYRQAKDGVADIVWTLPGYTSGLFPRSEVFEIPFVHTNNVVATNKAIQDMLADGDLDGDYNEVHPLFIHVHSGQAYHMLKKPIETIEDFEGLKIRTPNRIGSWVLEQLGANPVGMPVPQLPQAMYKGVIDGAMIPIEVAIPLKTHEMTNYIIEGVNDIRISTAVFAFLMNKKKYNELPDDLKKIIDDNSRKSLSEWVGNAWQNNENKAKETAINADNTLITLNAEELSKIEEKLKPVELRWVREMEEKGIDGEMLLDKARNLIEKYSN